MQCLVSNGFISKSAAAHPAKPILEEPACPAFFLILPELGEQFLGRPGPCHFQLQILQRGKFLRLVRAEILRLYSHNCRVPLRVSSPCAINSLCSWRRTLSTASPRYLLTWNLSCTMSASGTCLRIVWINGSHMSAATASTACFCSGLSVSHNWSAASAVL